MYMIEEESIEKIMVYGRWAVLTSCKRYIQAGRALLLTVDVPSSVAQLAQDVASDVSRQPRNVVDTLSWSGRATDAPSGDGRLAPWICVTSLPVVTW
jgi:hypothetical protein